MSLLIKGITKLSQLAIDTAKNWGGLKIENLGAPDSGDDAKRHDSAPAAHNQATSTITSGQFSLTRMPRGTDTHVLTGKGAGVDPAYEAPAGNGGSTVIWKGASSSVMTDLNRTSTLEWTDLDLTASTSANAELAILRLRLVVDSIVSGNAFLYVRKNGTTPDAALAMPALALDSASNSNLTVFIVGLDAGQVIEYRIGVAPTIQVDCYIDVLGYIE